MWYQSRRDVLTAGLGGLVWLSRPRTAGAEAIPTPRQSLGPFYPTRLPLDRDNDLLSFGDRGRRAEGIVTHVAGRILDLAGTPVRDSLVEIWQCDVFGRYHHSRDRGDGPLDPNFQGYGRFVTGPDGAYRFRTIRPVPYAWRTPHIHFAVKAPGLERLVTQMYVAGEPRNATDSILNGVRDPERRGRLIVPLQPFPEGEPGSLIGRFDIVLGRDQAAGAG